jgi:hypothetical protein
MVAGPETAADFAEIYRRLDETRSRAFATADVSLMRRAVTEDSQSLERVMALADAGQVQVLAPDTTSTIDEVALYHRASDSRVQLIVTDTVAGPILVTSGDLEVDRFEREWPTTTFLVTMVETPDGWRILADQTVTNAETGMVDIALEPEPEDSFALEVRDTRVPMFESRRWESSEDRMCVQVVVTEPALGRIAYCFELDAQAGTIDLYTIPLAGEPLHTVYFVATPGGEMRSVQFTVEGDGSSEYKEAIRPNFANEITVAAGVFEGVPTLMEAFDEEINLIFEAKP